MLPSPSEADPAAAPAPPADAAQPEDSPEEPPESDPGSADEPDLENPEFLFDGGTPEREGESATEPEPEPAPEPEAEAVPEAEYAAAPARDLGETSATELDFSDINQESAPLLSEPTEPDPPAAAFEREPIAADEAFFGDDDQGSEEEAAARPGPDAEFGVVDIPEADPAEAELGEIDGEALAAEIPDDGLSDWNLEDDEAPLAGDSTAPAGFGPSAPHSEPGARVVAPPPRAPAAPSSPEPEAALSGSARTLAQISAILVGCALIVGGLRGLVVQQLTAARGPGSVAGERWTASEIESFHLPVVGGRRLLVVRGRLRLAPDAPPLQVRASLLDLVGRPLGEPIPGLLSWLEGDALRFRAAAAGESGADPFANGVEGETDGFTVLILDPPEAARRFEIDLSPADPSF